MVERLVRIGRAVVDAFDIDRGRAEKQKPKPLSPDERHRLEKDCGQIVEKEDFGRKDFSDFCKDMISLARQEDDPKGYAKLRDQKAELNIDFHQNSISMRGNPVPTDDPHVLELGFSEDISYISQKVEYGLFGDKHSDFQPILITHDRVPVPKAITFSSYFKGKSEPAFPKGTLPVRTEKKVSDQEVQDFCRKVYGIYATDRLGLNFQPH